MKAYGIVILDSEQSGVGFRRLKESHEAVGNEFDLDPFPATTPVDVVREMARLEIRWDYPWEEHRTLPALGLRLHPYKTANRQARMACFMSHYRLWHMCASQVWDSFDELEPFLILEDDAEFIEKLDPAPLVASEYRIIGINDPRGATRLPGKFHEAVQAQQYDVCEVPWIDDREVPQGLAGASAYLMTTAGALGAVDAARNLGGWPNDALLCKQLFPGQLGTTKRYYTRVQRTPSTLA